MALVFVCTVTVSQLATYDSGIVHVEVGITDGAPMVVHADLDSPLVLKVPTPQSQTPVPAHTPRHCTIMTSHVTIFKSMIQFAIYIYREILDDYVVMQYNEYHSINGSIWISYMRGACKAVCTNNQRTV